MLIYNNVQFLFLKKGSDHLLDIMLKEYPVK